MTNWGEADAQAQFDAVLDKAESEGPQRITRGDRVFYIMTRRDWTALRWPTALKKRGSEPEKGFRTMSEFFENSSLMDSASISHGTSRGSGRSICRAESKLET